tara:strand:- start:1224 stop:1862 length:639 start_codon:yes stop_codon:yes gene_type:complete
MSLTLEQKQEIGRQVREENSGTKELQICELFGLTQVGGSRTKVDGTHPDGSNWSIKNAKSSSTQVHLTSQERFIEDFALNDDCIEFVQKFFGNLEYNHMPRRRYRIDEISNSAVSAFKKFLETNKEKVIYYFISGKFNINHLVYNRERLTTEQVMEQVRSANWLYNPTAIHLKNDSGKTLFHIQMKGSGKGKIKHGVLCHIHENLFHQSKEQ